MHDKREHCPRVRINFQNCSCTFKDCPRYGICCECLHYHRNRGELPACYFAPAEEKTYNRSIEFFFRRYMK